MSGQPGHEIPPPRMSSTASESRRRPSACRRTRRAGGRVGRGRAQGAGLHAVLRVRCWRFSRGGRTGESGWSEYCWRRPTTHLVELKNDLFWMVLSGMDPLDSVPDYQGRVPSPTSRTATPVRPQTGATPASRSRRRLDGLQRSTGAVQAQTRTTAWSSATTRAARPTPHASAQYLQTAPPTGDSHTGTTARTEPRDGTRTRPARSALIAATTRRRACASCRGAALVGTAPPRLSGRASPAFARSVLGRRTGYTAAAAC